MNDSSLLKKKHCSQPSSWEGRDLILGVCILLLCLSACWGSLLATTAECLCWLQTRAVLRPWVMHPGKMHPLVETSRDASKRLLSRCQWDWTVWSERTGTDDSRQARVSVLSDPPWRRLFLESLIGYRNDKYAVGLDGDDATTRMRLLSCHVMKNDWYESCVCWHLEWVLELHWPDNG